MPAFCDGPILWRDPQSGQLFTMPAEGRMRVGAAKDLILSASAIHSLYEDSDGRVYLTPGAGRTKLVAEAKPAVAALQPSTPKSVAGNSSPASQGTAKSGAGAPQSPAFPKVTVGALVYMEYFYDFGSQNLNSDGSHRNKFQLNRGYLNLRADLSPKIRTRITPDITRDSTGDIKLRTKFGYLEFHDLLKAYPSLDVKVGQYETAWLDYIEGLWTYRVIDTILIEREGFMNSGDLGLGLKGALPSGFGNWQIDVINGEGYHADENNKFKTVQGRLTLTPFSKSDWLKGLHLTGFASVGRQDQLHQRDRYIGFIGYKYHDDLFVGAEIDKTRGTDSNLVATPVGVNNVRGRGFSALLWYRMPFRKALRILGRFDQFTHNGDASSTTTTDRWIYGLSYDINRNVMLVLDNERSMYDRSLKSKNENLLKFDLQWTF